MNKELFMFFIRKITNYKPTTYHDKWDGWNDYNLTANVEFCEDGLIKMNFKRFEPEFDLVKKAICTICNGELRKDFFKNKKSVTVKEEDNQRINYKRCLYTNLKLNIYSYPLTFNLVEDVNIEILSGSKLKRKGLIEAINQHINEAYKKELQEFLKEKFKEYYLDYIDNQFSKKEIY